MMRVILFCFVVSVVSKNIWATSLCQTAANGAQALMDFSDSLINCNSIRFCDRKPSKCNEVVSCLPDSENKGTNSLIPSLLGLSGKAREKKILEFSLQGAYPEALGSFRRVTLETPNSEVKINIYVASDYYALGNDEDYTLMPMTNGLAQELAERWGFSLPSSKIVDAIYSQAEIKISARPFSPGPAMITTRRYLESNETIRNKLGQAKYGEQLVAGHKKDVVIAPRKNFVSIYGWAQPGKSRGEGRMPYIQPEGGPHDSSYVDYSHGIRFVNRWIEVEVNGQCQVTELKKALMNPELCKAISYKCPLNENQTKAAY